VIIDNNWYCELDGEKYYIDKNDFSFNHNNTKIVFDGVYNIIHGNPGENGRLQAYFEMLEIPFTSSNSTVSALTFNKAYCNYAVKALKVNVSESVHLLEGDNYNIDMIISQVGLPCFVKPNSGGSSIGMSKVKEAKDLDGAIKKAFNEDSEVLVESFFQGREITCGLIKTLGKIVVFPICEIVSKTEFFDYEAKYNEKLVEEIIPAPISEEISEVINTTSVYLYNKLNLKGVVRMDYIFNEDDEYIFLEANTIPGMSAQSIVPQMARAYGWTNTQLLDAVLDDIWNV
jgi:D-alanine-D-alanine ligase